MQYQQNLVPVAEAPDDSHKPTEGANQFIFFDRCVICKEYGTVWNHSLLDNTH